ncbi:MAG: hypothetical protein BGO12_14415 [Verrucomicrobia bacterium 61-8]|nr:MAG: hypothetical protein BGO12_14415 [Verrucomicrobia bacterium 61-8]
MFLLTAPLVCPAQDEAPATPITRPSGTMRWTLTFRDSPPFPQAGNNPYQVASIDISRSDQISRELVTFRNGEKQEYWRSGNTLFGFDAATKRLNVLAEDPISPPYSYSSPGFYGLDQVQLSHDQGVAEFDGARCLYFKGVRKAGVTGSFDSEVVNSAPSGYEAWFDWKTGLPKAYRENGRTLLYTFFPLPEEPGLPSEVRDAWERHVANLKAMGLAP